jgi:DNA polymerase-3 subunit epsilon
VPGIPDKKSRIFFDTETTGLHPGNICQLSYIKTTGDNLSSGNLYFMVDYIEPGAQKVHGLTLDTLRELSGNRRFYDRFSEIKSAFESADVLIAHNINFDLGFMDAEFKRCSSNFEYNDSMCTMRHFTNICKIPNYNRNGYKWPKLEEMIRFFGITQNQIISATQELFSNCNSGFHDARFDVTGTYLCYKEAEKLGLI